MDRSFGDKFTDGVVTLKNSKPAELTIVNGFDVLKNDVTNFKKEQESKNETVNEAIEKINKNISDIKTDHHSLENTFIGYSNTNNNKVKMLFIMIYNILQIWPLRFLNFIFRWWAFEIVNEELDMDGNTYIIYVMIATRSNIPSRRQMILCNKAFKDRIKCIKATYYDQHNKIINILIKPEFPI